VKREQRRTFYDPKITLPELEYKSWLNPIPYVSRFFYYTYQAPVIFARGKFVFVVDEDKPHW